MMWRVWAWTLGPGGPAFKSCDQLLCVTLGSRGLRLEPQSPDQTDGHVKVARLYSGCREGSVRWRVLP